jgi:membrane-associated phospholipid phosphatase
MTNGQAIRKNIFIFILFLAFTILSYHFWDIPIADRCHKLDRHFLDVWEFITIFGKSTGYLILSFLLFLFFRYYRKNEIYSRRSLFIFASVALSGIIVDIIKWIFGRYRPVMLFEKGLYGFSFFGTGYEVTSFSSGHAVTAFSMALALSVLYPKGRIFFFMIAIAVSASRVFLTSHFLSDAIFGAYIGIASVQLLNGYFIQKGWFLR